MFGRFQISMRTYFSLTHLRSAARFSRHARDVEQRFTGQYNHDLDQELQGASLAAMTCAASFLEASVNELFADAVDNTRISNLGATTIAELQRYVNDSAHYRTFRGQRRNGHCPNEILIKHQFALQCASLPLLNETAPNFVDARILIEARNELTHYEPENVVIEDSANPVNMQAIAQSLNGKFTTNPFARAGNHRVFPSLYLSHGAAAWAVNTALAFADDFWNALGFPAAGIPLPYAHIRQDCNPQ